MNNPVLSELGKPEASQNSDRILVLLAQVHKKLKLNRYVDSVILIQYLILTMGMMVDLRRTLAGTKTEGFLIVY